MANKLIVSAAPHITSGDTTSKIMQRVCLALVPTLIASVVIFGFNALILTAITVASCVIFEYAYCKLMGREVTINDFSAVVTGLLLAYNMPSGMPVWMAVVGSFIAIVIVKQLFGGLGFNFANPAIVGRIALALGYTGAMTTYVYPANGEGFNNECDMETPYAYIYADRHDRLCEIISECVNRSFGLGVGALPGNNDSGGLSSLLVWNVLGIFPVSGSGEFLVGSPCIDYAEIRLPHGKSLKISVEHSAPEQIYVDRVEFNGIPVEGYRIPARLIMQGGELKISMCG